MFNVVLKETKEFLRDKTNLFFFMLFPVVLVFLLGSLLGSMDQAEATVGEIKLQYLVDTDNMVQVAAINTFIETAGKEGTLAFTKADNLDTAKALAAKDEIAAVVEFSGDPLVINIYEGTNSIKNRAVGAVFQSFIQTNKAVTSVINTNPMALVGISMEQGEYIEQKDLGVSRSMIDYYAVCMIAMISFMSMLVGAGAFVGERQNKTINRLILAPQNKVFIFLQKILGMVPQVVLQITVIMICSVGIFKAHYAATMLNNLYLFFMFLVVTMCMISLGAVVGIVIKSNPMVVIMPVLWLMMFFGGTYSKELDIPGLTDAMPIHQIQQAAFDLAIFGRYEKTNVVIVTCILVMLAALAVGAYLFSKKEEER